MHWDCLDKETYQEPIEQAKDFAEKQPNLLVFNFPQLDIKINYSE